MMVFDDGQVPELLLGGDDDGRGGVVTPQVHMEDEDG
jgi:hypothetical protein